MSACFHAQQAAEKVVKALLTRNGRSFDKTHDLGALLALAEGDAAGIAAAYPDLEELTPFAVSGRYPGGPRATQEIARGQLALARRFFEHVRDLLGPYLDSEPSAT